MVPHDDPREHVMVEAFRRQAIEELQAARRRLLPAALLVAAGLAICGVMTWAALRGAYSVWGLVTGLAALGTGLTMIGGSVRAAAGARRTLRGLDGPAARVVSRRRR